MKQGYRERGSHGGREIFGGIAGYRCVSLARLSFLPTSLGRTRQEDAAVFCYLSTLFHAQISCVLTQHVATYLGASGAVLLVDDAL